MPAALQPPSRTATPTPIDALLAPLHLGSSPAPSPSRVPSPAAAAAPHRETELVPEADAVPVAASSGTSLFQRDITRPSLRRANHDAHVLDRSCLDSDVPPPPPRTASAGGWHAPRTARPVGSGVGIDVKGKGRAVEPHGDSEVNQEREVIVHKVLKTDSIASIAVKYGITPQALRTSNRLWPSDPLFLRSELLIPLDQCHLPSVALSRDDVAHARQQSLTRNLDQQNDDDSNDLMRWDADGGADRSRSGSRPELFDPRPDAGEPPPSSSSSAARTEDRQPTSSRSTTPAPTPRESSEFLTVWDDDGDAALCGGTKVLTPDLVSSLVYERTLNPFANVAAVDSSSRRDAATVTSSPEAHVPASVETRASSEPPGSPTLRIKRLPASQLAFFPASSTAPPLSQTPSRQTVGAAAARASPASPRKLSQRLNPPDDSSLFFRPLKMQLQQLSLPSFLLSSAPSSLSSSSSASLSGLAPHHHHHHHSHGGGRIRLPPSPGLSPSPSRGGGWGLLDFGAEEDEANQLVQLRQLQSSSTPPSRQAGPTLGNPNAGRSDPGHRIRLNQES